VIAQIFQAEEIELRKGEWMRYAAHDVEFSAIPAGSLTEKIFHSMKKKKGRVRLAYSCSWVFS
jgi:hypothetical protein